MFGAALKLQNLMFIIMWYLISAKTHTRQYPIQHVRKYEEGWWGGQPYCRICSSFVLNKQNNLW